MPISTMRTGLVILFVMGLFLFFAQPAVLNAQETQAAGTAEISQVSIEKLLHSLEDPQRLESLKHDLRTLLEVSEATVKEPDFESRGLLGQILAMVSDNMQVVSEILAEVGRNLLQVPALVADIYEQAQDVEVLKSWGEMLSKVIMVLLAGVLAQILAFRLLKRARNALEDQEVYSKGVRALLRVGNTFLELIPIAAFAAAAYGLLPLLNPEQGTQLVALTLINANVLVRLILAFTRLVLLPKAPSLRFLPLDNESVQYLYIWARRVSRVGVYGFFTLEAALILGLPGSLYLFLLKLLGLIITLMIIVLILQNRSDVTAWLRGDEILSNEESSDPNRPFARKVMAIGSLRKRLADFWHVIAVMFVVGMFITWVLEIEGGFYFVARAIVMTGVVVALTVFLIKLSRRGLEYLFKISDELKKAHPELETRANRYLPLIKHSVRGVIYVVAAFSILQAWGLGTISWILSPQGSAILSSFLIIFLIVGVAFLIWELASIKIENYLTKERQGAAEKKANTRALTLLPLLNNVLRIALILVAGMSVLSHLGINIAPLLAGAGVIGLAVGFGAQTLVRDVITGAFILMEDSIAVGDWVEAGGHAGTVEHLTIRTVTLRDLSGAVSVIPFGDVTSIKNNNRDYGYALVDAGVAYREDYGEVIKALQDVAVELRDDEIWGPDIIGELEIFGLNNLADSAVEVRVRMKTLPGRQFSIRRAFLERMKRVFDERGIEIPFPHQTVYFGVDKDGTAPPMRLLKELESKEPSTKAIEPVESAEKPEINYTSEHEASIDVVREAEQADETEESEDLDKERSSARDEK
ncbi:MAG: Mechanosensitive ion channel protein [Desulfonatronovibrio sp. MSAO_Bac4]|nr:MAG: Mechanosensitive ion channel protein [Desulfonatronovibrio sp. MSAO_Bac4]